MHELIFRVEEKYGKCTDNKLNYDSNRVLSGYKYRHTNITALRWWRWGTSRG